MPLRGLLQDAREGKHVGMAGTVPGHSKCLVQWGLLTGPL